MSAMSSDKGYLFSFNTPFIEEMYEQYKQDPDSVSNDWRIFFSELPAGDHTNIKPQMSYEDTSESNYDTHSSSTCGGGNCSCAGVNSLIHAYKSRGHMIADLDPLQIEQDTYNETSIGLLPEQHGITNLSQEIEGACIGLNHKITISELVENLKTTYCGKIALEYMHMNSNQEMEWLEKEFSNLDNYQISDDIKKKMVSSLISVEGFEQFLHLRFPGAKRFSVEGGETSILAMEAIIDHFTCAGAQKVILGMPHRGRLNTLTHIMKKPYHQMFSEFQGNKNFPDNMAIEGDVKYHMGYSSQTTTYSGTNIELSLVPNPSHLEAVNPVVAGKVRAEQDFINDTNRNKVCGILMHGDAAFAGQGVVYESIAMSALTSYNVGGIVHLIINNQIGFTTHPHKSRCARHPTNAAKIIEAPIIHVNGDDPENVHKVAVLAAKYRKEFQKDIAINLVCYRLYGHNEGDEPSFTQPVMYKAISQHTSPVTTYCEKIEQAGIGWDTAKEKAHFRQSLDDELKKAEKYKPQEAEWLKKKWSNIVWADNKNKIKENATGVKGSTLKKIIDQIYTIPEEAKPFARLVRILENRKKTFSSDYKGLDWAAGEALAYASLLLEGYNIRLSGQDSGRGTFSHRNSVLANSEDEYLSYTPLNHLSDKQGKYEVTDSLLSEYAAMGFEYGYSITNPNNLVLWEGQFGDFANGAQIMIDQFLAAGETKWQRMSGLVLLLPHGYEGQGPEHSSARPERYLQLCADNNMIVANCTTPASFFHILRRQIHRNIRKPLIIMTPKSLLRHKLAVSNLEDMADKTSFVPVIDDNHHKKGDKVTKLILCTGKIYYDLCEARNALAKESEIAIVRIEELYPYPQEQIAKILAKYAKAKIVWCQEEPKNMGYWQYIQENLVLSLQNHKSTVPIYSGRKASASTAVGYAKEHNEQQKSLVEHALNI